MTDQAAETQPPASPALPPPRIEAQYMQAAMQFWVNLNATIWQRLFFIAVAQPSAVAFSFAHDHSWFSLGVIFLTWLVSLVLVLQSISDQSVRTELTRQCNFIAEQLLQPFFAERQPPTSAKMPFRLYDLGLDRAVPHGLFRQHIGAFALILALTGFDGLMLYVCDAPGMSMTSTFLGLPLYREYTSNPVASGGSPVQSSYSRRGSSGKPNVVHRLIKKSP